VYWVFECIKVPSWIEPEYVTIFTYHKTKHTPQRLLKNIHNPIFDTAIKHKHRHTQTSHKPHSSALHSVTVGQDTTNVKLCTSVWYSLLFPFNILHRRYISLQRICFIINLFEYVFIPSYFRTWEYYHFRQRLNTVIWRYSKSVVSKLFWSCTFVSVKVIITHPNISLYICL
jgi:hypothetical protein